MNVLVLISSIKSIFFLIHGIKEITGLVSHLNAQSFHSCLIGYSYVTDFFARDSEMKKIIKSKRNSRQIVIEIYLYMLSVSYLKLLFSCYKWHVCCVQFNGVIIFLLSFTVHKPDVYKRQLSNNLIGSVK